MKFSETEEDVLNGRRRNIRSMIFHIRCNESALPYTKEEYPHVWRRMEQLASMSDETLMQEVEADYLLFEFTRRNPNGKLEFVGISEEEWRKFNESL